MALDRMSRRIHDLAHELADLAGATTIDAVEMALREAIARRRTAVDAKRALLGRIADRCAALPVRDGRTPDRIVGYDDAGLPG